MEGFAPLLSLYSRYVGARAAALPTLRSPQLSSLLTDLGRDARVARTRTGGTFFALLERPVTRVAEYAQQFSKLLGATAAEHVDHAALVAAVAAVEAADTHIKAALQKRVDAARLQAVEASISDWPSARLGPLVQDLSAESTRRFVREDELLKLGSKGEKRTLLFVLLVRRWTGNDLTLGHVRASLARVATGRHFGIWLPHQAWQLPLPSHV